jgi:hypothetical protein
MLLKVTDAADEPRVLEAMSEYVIAICIPSLFAFYAVESGGGANLES